MYLWDIRLRCAAFFGEDSRALFDELCTARELENMA